MSRRIVVVGDVLLDRDVDGRAERLCPDAPGAGPRAAPSTRERAGGAGLAATLLRRRRARRDAGHGARPRRGGHDAGGAARAPRHRGRRPRRRRRDGREGARARRRPGARAAGPRRAGAGDRGRRADAARDALAAADAVLVSDYGRGITADAAVRAALAGGAGAAGVGPPPARCARRSRAPRCSRRTWRRPRAHDGGGRRPGAAPAAPPGGRPRRAARWRSRVGAVGVVLVRRTGRVPPPAPRRRRRAAPATASRRAAAAARGRRAARGGGRRRGVTRPRARGRRRGGAAPRRALAAAGGAGCAERCAPRRRDRRATGGCFDLLHAGHVATLHAARALGDRLVVLLNSDASVRRLKGPGRPVVHQDDRAAMLRALRCVDEVVVFDEDTPEAALARLAPDVWVKGARLRRRRPARGRGGPRAGRRGGHRSLRRGALDDPPDPGGGRACRTMSSEWCW